MRRAFLTTGLLIALVCACVDRPAGSEVARPAGAPFAVPTFHCLGVYWSPPGGTADKEVLVRYRRQGSSPWKEALPMRYNPIPGTEEDLTDYRGSIVHLQPGTTYQIELTLAGTSTKAELTAKTWSETFPTGETMRVGDRDTTLAITESGTPQAYRVYDGRGATLDVKHKLNQCITVNASYVILRNFTLKGSGAADNLDRRPTGAIEILDGHDIVIENCDISDWGRRNPMTGYGFDYESAVYSRGRNVERVIIQRTKMHHPAIDSNTWYEPVNPTHPQGPQAVSFFDTAGHHVIRYNECYSDMDHMFNDIIGGGSNGSFRGAPGPDSDVYGNFVSHCWDDGLEIEGGNRNTRIWDNYITQSMMMIGNAATSIGPLYMWRNVTGRSQWKPDYHGGNFVKMGFAGGEQWMTGHMYLFHNTVFRADENLPTGGFGGNRIVKHAVTRNNIIHLRAPENTAVSSNKANIDNDYDFDLYNGRILEGTERHGVQGEPVYAKDAGFDEKTRTGRFQLAPNSPGAGAGQPIPNFSDDYSGKAPDIGAHQRGAPPIRYGVKAKQS